MVRSEWLIFGRDFTVRTIAVETVGLCLFFVRSSEFQIQKNHKK